MGNSRLETTGADGDDACADFVDALSCGGEDTVRLGGKGGLVSTRAEGEGVCMWFLGSGRGGGLR